jgi:hypothetical protein
MPETLTVWPGSTGGVLATGNLRLRDWWGVQLIRFASTAIPFGCVPLIRVSDLSSWQADPMRSCPHGAREAVGHNGVPDGTRLKIRISQGLKGPQVAEVVEVDAPGVTYHRGAYS